MKNNIFNHLANKYLHLYEDDSTSEEDVCCTFADECFGLDIEMDSLKSFIDTYGYDAAWDAKAFECSVSKIDNAVILASGIFSKWRYITHWSYCEHCLDPDHREWFIIAFKRLSEITA